MSLTFTSPITALPYGRSINLAAEGGTLPYVYSLGEGPDAAGGTILPLENGSVTYTAPTATPKYEDAIDEIIVTDADGATAAVQIIVGDHLTIFCDILAHELNIPGRVFLANQKFNWPKDTELFLVVDELTDKQVSSSVHNETGNNSFSEIQTINAASFLSVHIYSRGLAARKRRYEVLMALASTYSKNQQVRSGMSIAQVMVGNAIHNLSEVDGDAMMNHFHFDVVVLYTKKKITAVEYADSFEVEEKINA